MIVTCPICDVVYDDAYQLTYCPHDKFKMHTVATRYNLKTERYETQVCTDLHQLDTFIGHRETQN